MSSDRQCSASVKVSKIMASHVISKWPPSQRDSSSKVKQLLLKVQYVGFLATRGC